MRIIDVRHEQTAVFGAEATAKLSRTPGFAAVTAGPGVTNAVSALTTAHLNGSPMVVVGGRAPGFRWGAGSLQELDHPPILSTVTKRAFTIDRAEDVPAGMREAFAQAASAHRGPVFADVPMDQLFMRPDLAAEFATPAAHASTGPGRATDSPPAAPAAHAAEGGAPAAPLAAAAPGSEDLRRASHVEPDPEDLARIAQLISRAQRPVVVLGSDVWTDGAEHAAQLLVEEAGLPTILNGMGRGILPRGHTLLVHRARSLALKDADLVVVIGTPLDFRLSFGDFGSAAVVHITDAPGQAARHVTPEATAEGSLRAACDGLLALMTREPRTGPWREKLTAAESAALESDTELLEADSDPIHPARVYGELRRALSPEAVVICDGGDFVSYAGRYLSPGAPGCWLDPGPYGCLGTGLGYAAAARLARPGSQVVALLGDGAAGFSLMDVDTLVRHNLPVVMVVGNNDSWGLEKHPMRFLYGYDVAADLAPGTRYDEVVTALGGGGERVTRAADLAGALRRGFDSDVPYLINVALDPSVAYPRSSNLA